MINKHHLPEKRPRCFVESPNAQDAFRHAFFAFQPCILYYILLVFIVTSLTTLQSTQHIAVYRSNLQVEKQVLMGHEKKIECTTMPMPMDFMSVVLMKVALI